MGPMSDSAEAGTHCPNTPSLRKDIAWLLHRAAHRMRTEWDAMARENGLRDLRDWIVLTAICEGAKRTQLAIGLELGLDKTTLTSLLDRLERDGFVVRTLDPNDRRARIPELTPTGAAVQAKMVLAREKLDGAALKDFSPQQQEAFFTILVDMAGLGDNNEEPLHGSCMR